MKTDSDPLIRQLRSIDPVDESELVSHLTDARMDQLIEAVLSSSTSVSGKRLPSWPGRRFRAPLGRRVVAPAAIMGILLTAVALTLIGGLGGDGRAVSALDEVASAAASQPAPEQDLPYKYLKTRNASIDTAVAKGESWSFRRLETREVWVADDREGRLRVTVAPPQFVGPGDQAAWEAAGKPNFLPSGFAGRTFERSIPAGGDEEGHPGLDPASLSSDPDQLYAQVARNVSQVQNSAPPAARQLDLIAATLRDPAVLPEDRATLYEAAAAIPGIEYLGEATDSIGRDGVGVGVTSDYSGGESTFQLVYEPGTARVLETRTTVLEAPEFADVESPFVVTSTTFISSDSVKIIGKN